VAAPKAGAADGAPKAGAAAGAPKAEPAPKADVACWVPKADVCAAWVPNAGAGWLVAAVAPNGDPKRPPVAERGDKKTEKWVSVLETRLPP